MRDTRGEVAADRRTPGAGGRGCARAAAAALALTGLVSGCQGRDDLVRDVTVPVTQSPGGPPYTQEEWALYREAVKRVERFEKANQELLAEGEATQAAEEFYRDHLRDWQQDYALLEQYERKGIRIRGAPVVVSTEPASIQSFQDNAADIVLRRCIDESDREVTRGGHRVPWGHDEPVVQEVTVHQYENRTWEIGTFVTTDEPCLG